MRLAADLLLLAGALLCLLAALGILRMPDVYNRIQAGTKSVTLGAVSFLLGIALLHPDWWAKVLCIGGFILFTSPVGSSTIARAVYLAGVRPWQASVGAPSGGRKADSLPEPEPKPES
jgi:multicomponent Na+:H+ antiporter subunit G